MRHKLEAEKSCRIIIINNQLYNGNDQWFLNKVAGPKL